MTLTSRLIIQMLLYHRDSTSKIIHSIYSNNLILVCRFDFYISDSYECYMPQLTMYMFNEIAKDAFYDMESLVRFVLIISKSYQENPYHNLFHAFNVCHSMYNMCKRNLDLFTPIEVNTIFTLFV